MDALPVEVRNQLAAVIKAARRAGESGARRALDVLAAGAARPHASLSPADQDLRRRLRAHGRQLGDRRDPATGVQQLDRLAHEVAYEHWHRMLFARFLAENELLIEPESGVAVSLDECEELAQEQGQDRWTLAGRFAERMLPRVFRSRDPALEVPLAPEVRQALQRLLESLPAAVFTARGALGWTYQFWQTERKEGVNKSGVKIGAEELPAVTQLFTERYMVLFLLHNTVGAWRAGRILAENPELAATAASEDELRGAVRLAAHGGYDFGYLRFVREPRDGDAADRPSGPWRPAAGAFAGWPRGAAALRVLDPCCGSGHFLVECLDLLVRLRIAEEGLAPPAAVDAVLRDNLFGLEIDPRCTQIAAFNLALAAWTWPAAGGYRPLPPLNLACSGIAPNSARDEWTRLAEEAAHAGGLPVKRDLLGAEDTLISAPLRNSLGALHVLSADRPARDWRMAGIDVSAPRGQRPIRAGEKAALLRGKGNDFAAATETKAADVVDGIVHTSWQRKQHDGPYSRIIPGSHAGGARLSTYAETFKGICSGDSPRFQRVFWERSALSSGDRWALQQSSIDNSDGFSGREKLFLWDDGNGEFLRHARERLGEGSTSAWIRGGQAWGRAGVAVKIMGELPVTRYTGEIYDNNVAVIVPRQSGHLSAIWAYCSSAVFREEVRRLNPKLSVTDESFVAVPFDLAHWQKSAAQRYPNGIPEPYSDNPTQWIFHGHPAGSVVWDDEAKRTTHGPRRIDATVLQVAVARLLGYRWPAEQDVEMRLAGQMRMWVDRCRSLDRFADADGIVCLASVSGESAAADRLRLLLAAAYGDDWSAATERQLLAAAAPNGRPAESIEEWLRDRFFEEHCRLFHQRPFVWHVWDGRRDGFHALLNYHRLAGPDGEGRRTLEALTYRHLGDWLARQKADRDHGAEGADGRLAAAQDLQNQLVKIMAGEPPCDLFVRWKPLGEQPIGWEPDLNDGVRINIRPFMSVELARAGRAGAGILRAKPKIAWNKDRGKEALKPRKRWKPPWLHEGDGSAEVDDDVELRPREEYPWFWGCPGAGTQAERTDFPGGSAFDGNRWNDLHYTNAVKRAARSSPTAEGSP